MKGRSRLWDLLHRCPCYCRRCNYCHTGSLFCTNRPWPIAPARFYGNCNSLAPPPPLAAVTIPAAALPEQGHVTVFDCFQVFRRRSTPVRASHCGNILVWNHSRVCTIYLIAAWKWGSCYFGFLSLSTRLHISKLLQCENCVLKKKNKIKKRDCGLVL